MRCAAALAFPAVLLFALMPRARAQQMQSAPIENMSGATPTPGQVSIPELPSITLTAVPGYGVAPLTVGFEVSAVDPAGAGFVSYQWNFGDGHVSTDPPLMATNIYTQPGTYIVTLTATTADGRVARASAGVIVRPAPTD